MSTPAPARAAARRHIVAWALWDCGATGVNAIVVTFVFSVYLTEQVGAGLPGPTTPASWLGRALAVAEDPAWSAALEAAFAADDPVGEELFDGLVKTLSRWGWPAGRPGWVTWVPSRTRPLLLADTARRLAELGRMQLVEALAADGPGFQRDAATNVEAAARALERLSVADDVPAGPVLLLDDTTRSGFTLTVAAALLRESGSGPVYPLVLHKNF